MKIGERIRRMREQRRLSSDDLAMQMGKWDCCLSCIENGKKSPTFETVKRIAQALGVEPHQLFYDGSQPPSLRYLTNRLTCDDVIKRGH